MNKREEFDWPGWRLRDNPYGKDFDLEARKRMIKGSRMLQPIIQKYKSFMGKFILEVGPFFNPLINLENFPNSFIFYWENDKYVLKWLKDKKQKNVYPLFCDLNKIEGHSFLKLKLETEKILKHNGRREYFDSVVVSHVLNYIDYKMFLIVLKDFLKKDGLLFINNVIDYGLPLFFSQKRPRSNKEIIDSLKEIGYSIVEKRIVEAPDKKYQKNNRLIVVCKNMK